MYSTKERRSYQNNRYIARRKWAIDLLGGKCVTCGCTFKLTFDHVIPTDKEYNLSEVLRGKPKYLLINELKKCQLLCKKCHTQKTIQEGSFSHIGEKNGCSKLNENHVLSIRKDTRTSRKIAKDYGISHVTVLAIKHRKLWGHVI